MIDKIYECIKDLKKENIFFYYNGMFPYEVISEVGEIILKKTTIEDVKKNKRNRLFSVIVEQMQNIYFYSTKKDDVCSRLEHQNSFGEGAIIVGNEKEDYFVICGNIIKTEKIDFLRNKIEKLQAMSKQELKQYYNLRRKQEPEKDSKGASLGLIEMAKRASKPLEFYFKEIDDKHNYFILKTTI